MYHNESKASKIDDNEPKLLAEHIRKYEMLLYKIAIYFEYCNNEVPDLVRQINSYAITHYVMHGSGLSLKVWLSKIMVRRCIYSISKKMFSEYCSAENIDTYGYHATYKTSHGSELRNIPLSFRAVYILYDILKFNEAEIAEILNTDIISVKVRRNKALMLVKVLPG